MNLDFLIGAAFGYALTVVSSWWVTRRRLPPAPLAQPAHRDTSETQ